MWTWEETEGAEWRQRNGEMEKGQQKAVSEIIREVERRDRGSHDSLWNREVRYSEGRWRMEKTGKKGSVKGAVGGNCEENTVCMKGGERWWPRRQRRDEMRTCVLL